jgi:hypothetical protein
MRRSWVPLIQLLSPERRRDVERSRGALLAFFSFSSRPVSRCPVRGSGSLPLILRISLHHEPHVGDRCTSRAAAASGAAYLGHSRQRLARRSWSSLIAVTGSSTQSLQVLPCAFRRGARKAGRRLSSASLPSPRDGCECPAAATAATQRDEAGCVLLRRVRQTAAVGSFRKHPCITEAVQRHGRVLAKRLVPRLSAPPAQVEQQRTPGPFVPSALTALR